ncbi:MAG: hypothetical protein HQ561_07055, partial [Desulfobacteraceae bacterium]|nr:hypothetical protein [Desulfobacteraceae bacterium]
VKEPSGRSPRCLRILISVFPSLKKQVLIIQIKWAREKMAAYKYPRIVEFVDELPKTGSIKILKRVLRDREVEKKDRSI